MRDVAAAAATVERPDAPPPCAAIGCPALVVTGSHFRSVHSVYAVRESGSAVVRCYACGDRIDVGYRWIVLAEGAFHNRLACLSKPPHEWSIRVADWVQDV